MLIILCSAEEFARQRELRELKIHAAKQEFQLQQERLRKADEEKMRVLQEELELQDRQQQERLVLLKKEAAARQLQVQNALEAMAVTTLQSAVRKRQQRKIFMLLLRCDVTRKVCPSWI